MQAPSCWDGKYLDTPDHKAHMAYPIVMGANQDVCPTSHPVALPMIEFKMAWPVNGDMSQVSLASGAGHSFHYDFFNAWDDATLNALVGHCSSVVSSATPAVTTRTTRAGAPLWTRTTSCPDPPVGALPHGCTLPMGESALPHPPPTPTSFPCTSVRSPSPMNNLPPLRRSSRIRRRATARLAAAALLAGAVAALPVPAAHAAGSIVKVTGSQGDWQLTVDGSPYTVKGLTWGPSVADAGQYMPDVKSIGINTIRTWGTDTTAEAPPGHRGGQRHQGDRRVLAAARAAAPAVAAA
ncbi:hypothetical protein SMICM17S_06914 [Streptomyces microflavus]